MQSLFESSYYQLGTLTKQGPTFSNLNVAQLIETIHVGVVTQD